MRYLLPSALLAAASWLLMQSAAMAAVTVDSSTSSNGSDATAFLTAYTHDLKALQGRFVQTVYGADGQQIEQSTGDVSLAVPRQFRWEYKDPFPQLIVADGDRVWVYDPDLEQVSVRRQGTEEQQSPLLVLIDPTELERQFIVDGPNTVDDTQRLDLKPRDEGSGMTKAQLIFADNVLQKMWLQDSVGQRTEIRFSNWERNPTFAGGWFRFDPPAGVDVVGDTGESAQVTPLGD